MRRFKLKSPILLIYTEVISDQFSEAGQSAGDSFTRRME